MNCRVLHVVRRFGPVGGMERYVWNLVHALAEIGVTVEVLCESVEGDPSIKIKVHRVMASGHRRRWKAMREFVGKCNDFWELYERKLDLIVHSHERCSFHDITTFHGPPIRPIRVHSILNKLSSRIRYWCSAEYVELLGDNVKTIVPVSAYIGSQIVVRT